MATGTRLVALISRGTQQRKLWPLPFQCKGSRIPSLWRKAGCWHSPESLTQWVRSLTQWVRWESDSFTNMPLIYVHKFHEWVDLPPHFNVSLSTGLSDFLWDCLSVYWWTVSKEFGTNLMTYLPLRLMRRSLFLQRKLSQSVHQHHRKLEKHRFSYEKLSDDIVVIYCGAVTTACCHTVWKAAYGWYSDQWFPHWWVALQDAGDRWHLLLVPLAASSHRNQQCCTSRRMTSLLHVYLRVLLTLASSTPRKCLWEAA